jgi:hypothetical protein
MSDPSIKHLGAIDHRNPPKPLPTPKEVEPAKHQAFANRRPKHIDPFNEPKAAEPAKAKSASA